MSEVLKNKNIVVTRSEEQASGLIELLDKAGASTISIPAIKIIPAADYNSFDDFIMNSAGIDYIIFTSSNSVKYFLRRLEEINLKLNLNEIKIAVVGETTLNACAENNIHVDIIPEEFNTSGLLKIFDKINIKDKNILIPCSAIARTELSRGLKQSGANVNSTPVYDVVLPDAGSIESHKKILNEIKPDLFVFTSPSAYANFLKMFDILSPEEFFKNAEVAAIGPTTAAAISDSGADVDIVPDKYTAGGLFEKIIEHYSNK